MSYNFENVKLNHPYTRKELCEALGEKPINSGKGKVLQLNRIKQHCILSTSGQNKGKKYIITDLLNTPTYATWKKSKFTSDMRILLLSYFQNLSCDSIDTDYTSLAIDLGLLHNVQLKGMANPISEQRAKYLYTYGTKKIKDTIKVALNSLQKLGIINWTTNHTVIFEDKLHTLSDKGVEQLKETQAEVAVNLGYDNFYASTFADVEHSYEQLNQALTDKYKWTNYKSTLHIEFPKAKLLTPVSEPDLSEATDNLKQNLVDYLVGKQATKFADYQEKEYKAHTFGKVTRHPNKKTSELNEHIAREYFRQLLSI